MPSSTLERVKLNLGQCLAELPIEADRNVWYCIKPEGHEGQHEATVKWGRTDTAPPSGERGS